MSGQIVKLAAIREAGYPQGVTAPCWFHCSCGDKVPAFQGEQTCTCGTTYDSRGWIVENIRTSDFTSVCDRLY